MNNLLMSTSFISHQCYCIPTPVFWGLVFTE